MARVAILTHGGLANPARGIVVPALFDWLERLSDSAELTVFSLRGPETVEARYALARAEISYLETRRDDRLHRRIGALYRAVVTEHRCRPFDVAHGIWGLPGGLAAVILGKRLGIPSVISLQGAETADLPDHGYGMLASRIERGLLTWACKRASTVTALTVDQRKRLARVVRRDVLVIPYGADPDQFRFRLREPEPPYALLHVAHQNPIKDQHTLLQAFARIRARTAARLTLVGGDYLGGALARLAHELGITDSVAFAGEVPHRDLPAFFDAADCLVHTSRYEAQGVVIAEALSAGLPVISTHVGLAADLAGSALVTVPIGDADALADAILDTLAEPGLVKRFSDAGHSWASTHDANSSPRTFAALYERLCGGAG